MLMLASSSPNAMLSPHSSCAACAPAELRLDLSAMFGASCDPLVAAERHRARHAYATRELIECAWGCAVISVD